METKSKIQISKCPQEVLNLSSDTKYFGQMNDPTSAAWLKGPCGDSMEFYLVIENRIITDIKYYTQGCNATKSCAAMTAYLAKGKSIEEALKISAGEVMEKITDLPENHRHCSILAVSTFYRAVADYLLAKQY